MNTFKKFAAACLALICTFGMGAMISCSKESGDTSSSSQSQSVSESSDSTTTENSNLPACEEGKAASTAATVENATEGKISHEIHVIYPNGSPAVGVMVIICQGSSCQPYTTNTNGVADVEVGEGEWEAHLTNIPQGYTNQYDDTDAVFALSESHSIVVFKLKQA